MSRISTHKERTLFISRSHQKSQSSSGFTIVELLVVIVVIGILASLALVSYSGISSRAIAASLQADLTNSTRTLKMYYTEYGTYPQSLDDGNCPEGQADSRYCLKPSSGNTLSYCSTLPYNTFLLVNRSSSGVGYQVTESTAPVAGGNGSLPVFCSGGTIAQNGNTRTHTFDSSCTSAAPCVVTANASGTITITALGAGGGGGRDDEEQGYPGSNGDRVVYEVSITKGDSLTIVAGRGSISASAPAAGSGYTNGFTGGAGGVTSCYGGAGDDGPGLPGVGGGGSSGVRRAGVRLVEAKGGAGGQSGGFFSDSATGGCDEWTSGGLGGAGGGTNYPSLTTAGGGASGGAHNSNGADGSIILSYLF